MTMIGFSSLKPLLRLPTLTIWFCFLTLAAVRAQDVPSESGMVVADHATRTLQDNVGNASSSTAAGEDLDCTFRTDHTLLDGLLTLKHIVNPVEGTMVVELIYEDEGWVGFGLSPQGKMAGAEVVVAKPAGPVNGSNPGKYRIASKTVAGIQLLDAQTLLNATYEQANGQTIVRYSKRLAEDGEMEIFADGENTFIFAAGSDNDFQFHGQQHGSITLPRLTKCLAADGSSMDDLVLTGKADSGAGWGFNMWHSFRLAVMAVCLLI